jgi:hypothetical protein
MNEQEREEVSKILAYRGERTLLLGYDCDRNTWHVYLQNGEIHKLVYDHNLRVVSYFHADSFACRTLCPDKRAFSESTDYVFAKLIAERIDEYGICFTTHDDEAETLRRAGERGRTTPSDRYSGWTVPELREKRREQQRCALTRASTRELLAWRDGCYRVHGGSLTPEQIEEGYGYDITNNGGSEVPLKMILAELGTREHVPNKQERAEIRRAKQKEKQNR